MFRKAEIMRTSPKPLETDEENLGHDKKIESERGLVNGQLSIFLRRYVPWALLFVGLVIIPAFYYTGLIAIGTVNMLGRYMAFAIVAVGLDLI